MQSKWCYETVLHHSSIEVHVGCDFYFVFLLFLARIKQITLIEHRDECKLLVEK